MSLKRVQEKSLWVFDFLLTIVLGSLLYFLLFLDAMKEFFFLVATLELLGKVSIEIPTRANQISSNPTKNKIFYSQINSNENTFSSTYERKFLYF